MRVVRLERTRLAVEILRAYVQVRRLLRRYDLPTTIAILRDQPDAPPTVTALDSVDETGVRLGRAVGRVLANLPVDDRCLTRSLVLTRLLAARGLDSALVIGVTSEPEFGAHAWVERGEVALLPRNGSAFQQLVRL